MLQVISALTIREYAPPFTRNVVLCEPVSYIPTEKFNFDESVSKLRTHSGIDHVKNFLTEGKLMLLH